jgi:8-oxo-dGTP pyrophosphatase MutT (NUDIX family)
MKAASAIPRSVAARTAAGTQVAALPYRVINGRPEILLITSRRTQRWIVPKGWPEKGSTPAADAAREAFEEAGVSGEIAGEALGVFHYIKEMKHGLGIPCRVSLYALKVTRQHRSWSEKAARETKWHSVGEAAALVSEPELRRLILKFGARVTAPKQA